MTTSFAASERAMISASAVESATHFCFVDPHATQAPAAVIVMSQAEVEKRVLPRGVRRGGEADRLVLVSEAGPLQLVHNREEETHV